MFKRLTAYPDGKILIEGKYIGGLNTDTNLVHSGGTFFKPNHLVYHFHPSGKISKRNPRDEHTQD